MTETKTPPPREPKRIVGLTQAELIERAAKALEDLKAQKGDA